MADHRLAEPATPRSATEPVSVAEGVRVVLAALVATGWLTIDAEAVNWIVTAVGLVASVVLSWRARRVVTPVVEPRSSAGVRLAPVPSPKPPPSP